jgi:hypothetical protein
MTEFQEIVSQLTDDQLKEAFFDYEGYNAKGTLAEDSIIRMVHNRMASQLKDDNWDPPCFVTSVAILHEIAKRHYMGFQRNRK